MGSKAPKAEKPKEPNIGKDITQYVKGYKTALPTILGAEQKYRPQFGALNLADIGQYQQGLQSLQGAEMAGAQGLAGQARGLLGSLNPESQRMMQLQNMQAEEAYASSQGLTAQEKRSADQTAREAFGSAGRLGGNYSVASELLNRDKYLTGKKQNAFDMIGQSYNTSRNFYQPALGMVSGSLQGGIGLLGQSVPQMINPDTGVNIASAHRQNVNNANMANAQSSASSKAGMYSAVGSIGGAVVGAALI